jgi:hypothetical protein
MTKLLYIPTHAKSYLPQFPMLAGCQQPDYSEFGAQPK